MKHISYDRNKHINFDSQDESARWSSCHWAKINKHVEKLRSQIYLAKLQKNENLLRRLQNSMLNSKANILYSIRRVTSINRGAKTPGPDKLLYLTPRERYNLYIQLSNENILNFEPSPVRRVEIPRPGKSPRPLGIPNIIDRIQQMRIKNALEPEWEAIFEHGSYGFRPGRGAHDAMMRIWRILSSKKRRYALDADIKGCFNNIAHDPLLKQIEGFPGYFLIKKWLKAGYFKDSKFYETEIGTPQGGIVSPLLANIALHGMEEVLGIKYRSGGYVKTTCPYILVRYADDFIILCTNEEDAINAQKILSPWLSNRGMEFASDKTRIVKVTSGFDFLGWNFRLFHRSHGRKKHWMRSKSNFVTLVKPSLKSIKTLKQRIKEIWRKGIGKAAWITIIKLNPLITGWTSYHKFVNSDKIFRSFDNFMYLQSVRFIRRTHANKSWHWLIRRYFKTLIKEHKRKNGRITTSLNNWTFHDRIYLNTFRSVSLENFVSVQFGRNPLNPSDKGYYLQRKNERLVKRSKFLKVLFTRQNGICPFCGSELSSDWDEPVHVHHIIPRSVGGPEVLSNLVLLHEECHHNLHSLGVENFNTTKYLKKNSKNQN